ncbi:hypothetical protein ED733_006871 [Metarhizium rileyi]|uniref:Rhamnogalacturonase A/B/Epimerase-like pectate lyase domain-containing protein n=1 Tax=Metarhizium rileyi (strain RCEF 4871) TaxID=1649241 RepID=A0A5C6GH82_METRR|nr:hypothetical protein ED733_006871 [Metarhizium rileyi]
MFLNTVLALLLLGTAAAVDDDGHYNSSEFAAPGTGYWYANMDHYGPARGQAPDLSQRKEKSGKHDPTDMEENYPYEVFIEIKPREVKPAASQVTIQEAIDRGSREEKRQNQLWASQPRVVYLHPGIYETDMPIELRANTILMGDAADGKVGMGGKRRPHRWCGPPQPHKEESFLTNDASIIFVFLVGMHLKTQGLVGETSAPSSSHMVGLKNVILDTRNIEREWPFYALQWGVAKGAYMQNVKIIMAEPDEDQGHMGVFVGEGSSLAISDMRFENGLAAVWHQSASQMLYKRIETVGTTHGFLITEGAVVSIINSTFQGASTVVVHRKGSTWVGMVDCKVVNSEAVFSTTEDPSLLIENLHRDDETTTVMWKGAPIVTGTRYVEKFSFANTYGQEPVYGPKGSRLNRPAALVRGGGAYPAIAAPTYPNKPVSDFINVLDPAQTGNRRVLGDFSIDVSGALNDILEVAVMESKVVYFPFGNYRVDSTVFVPPGSRIVGEAWATISGRGNFFADQENPRPVLQVGKQGDVGVAHIQELRVTVADTLPGAILVQVNMAGRNPGDVAIWNTMITVGGTVRSQGIERDCADPKNPCKGAFLGLHLTESSSAYLENTWVMVPDWNSEMDRASAVAGKGGVLIQATKGTWIHGLSSQQWWLYQLNLWEAKNVFISLFLAEPSFYQGSNALTIPPAPWEPEGKRWNDPDFSWCGHEDLVCHKGLSHYITGGSDIRHYATASWDFYNGEQNGCDDGCSDVMHWVSKKPSNLHMYGVCSRSSTNVLREADGNVIPADPHFLGGWPGEGSSLGVYELD